MPFESARVEYAGNLHRDTKRGHVLRRMVQNITGRLKNQELVRVDMSLKLSKSIASVIGRSAHIRVLDCLELQTVMAYVFTEYLD